MTTVLKIVTPSTRTESRTEITRWTVKGPWCDALWDELIKKLQRLFRTRSTCFFLSWFDGEDYCTIQDVSDLQEAVECMQENSSANKGVRIYASPENVEHHTVFGIKPSDYQDEQNEDSITAENKEATKPAEPVIAACTSEMEDLDIANEIAESERVVEETVTTEPAVMKQDAENVDSEASVAAAAVAAVPASAVAATGAASAAANITSASVSELERHAAPNLAANTATPNPQTIPYQTYMPQYPMHHMYMPQWGYGPITPMAYPTGECQFSTQPPHQVPTAPPMSMIVTNTTDNTVSETPGTLAALAAQAQEQPKSVPSTAPGATPVPPKCELPKKEKSSSGSSKSQYITMCTMTLRSMGYKQDDKTLRRVIKKHKGNLNSILDELNRSASESTSAQ